MFEFMLKFLCKSENNNWDFLIILIAFFYPISLIARGFLSYDKMDSGDMGWIKARIYLSKMKRMKVHVKYIWWSVPLKLSESFELKQVLPFICL